jgi:hypothetical protein
MSSKMYDSLSPRLSAKDFLLLRSVSVYGFRATDLSREFAGRGSLSPFDAGKLYHMGFRGKVARSTLADANESRDATESGRPDLGDGSDYYDAFANYTEAFTFSQGTEGAEAPLALVRQLEYIEEPNPGEYRQVKGVRITEWHVEFLRRPRRTPNTIPDSYRRTRPPTGWIDAGVWQIRMSKTKPSVNRCNQPLAPDAVSE